MTIDEEFGAYFAALDRAGTDRCFVCRRTPADVKRFFGFREDGTPLDASHFGIEHIAAGDLDVMSYRAERPVCAVCQLNVDAIFLGDEGPVLLRVLRELKEERDKLWPGTESTGDDAEESA